MRKRSVCPRIPTNPFRYTGREFDTETSLYFNRARYYTPDSGRFLSEDPAGFFGGFNFYGYVKNDPVNFLDPSGLKCEQASPWTEIPRMSGNGPTPYLIIDEGLDWVRTGWSYFSLGILTDYTKCICQWVATHTRVRKFYRVSVTEQALFVCDCPPSEEYRTRTRIKESQADGPGNSIIPTAYGTTHGSTYQAGELTGLNPRDKRNVGCTCLSTWALMEE